MPFLILIPIALVAGMVIGYILSDSPPSNALWTIHISKGFCTFEGAPIDQWKKSSVINQLSRWDIETGFIAKNAESRIVFSETIPEEVRQQLRNVLN
jgi:hypothetical protein